MSDDRAFERATRDWLEAGSDQTPASAIDAVLLAIKTTPQERDLGIPWRTPRMSMLQRLAAGIAIVAVLGVAGLTFLNRSPGIGGSPASSPSASPTAAPTIGPAPSPAPIDPATWTPFTSARHGYAARYPSDWTLTLGSAPANLADLTDAVGPFFDHVKSNGAPADEILGVSTRLPAGMSEADWITAYRKPVVDAYGAKCFPPPSEWEPVTVDGQAGGLYVGCNYVESTTFVGGRAYIFTVARPLGIAATDATEGLLRAFLSTVTIDASAADDTPVTP